MIKIPEEIIPTRRSLLTRLKQWDDHESWKDFFDTYWKLVYSAALNETEAQEVVQETVIAVAKKMHAFKYDPAVGSFKSWLLHITRCRIADQLRKRYKEAVVVQAPSNDTSRTDAMARTAGTIPPARTTRRRRLSIPAAQGCTRARSVCAGTRDEARRATERCRRRESLRACD